MSKRRCVSTPLRLYGENKPPLAEGEPLTNEGLTWMPTFAQNLLRIWKSFWRTDVVVVAKRRLRCLPGPL